MYSLSRKQANECSLRSTGTFVNNSIDRMSVLFLFFCDIITTGNDVSLLEIENRKNKADDVYDFFCRSNQFFNFYGRLEII